MCGIVAYVGSRNCKRVLINGLKRLEYRGYDSAGIGVLADSSGAYKVTIVKEAGKIKELEEELKNINTDGHCGIGHTRW
ncbi:MAG: hypothetical protein R6U35_00740, partial [Candidatus Humimicrobiaceae bacterium]